ncbi:NAD(+) diphosphatase [Luteococcus peritonei]|uniref:NAD(+) diphosphatase n=1 Tax=Luteococcus peritonei TaxID=88874 RepID=A0ABW4RXF9_9ACTN
MSEVWNLHSRLDRMGLARVEPQTLEALWAEPGALLVEVGEGGLVADPLGRPVTGSYNPQRDVLLGRTDGPDGHVWFARRGELTEGRTLRSTDFDAADLEVVTAATAVLAWHDAARFCERCGAATQMSAGGFQRTCTACGRLAFPRTDPAMIVAVLDEQDRLLLAHQASWPEGRVSILAGFLEAGESAEHAVVREVREESGLEVSAAHFLSSQPWPYPRSLMLGYVARAAGEVRVDGEELAWATWYTPEDLAAAEAGGLTLPGLGSIAGRIIQAWRRGELPRPELGSGL